MAQNNKHEHYKRNNIKQSKKHHNQRECHDIININQLSLKYNNSIIANSNTHRINSTQTHMTMRCYCTQNCIGNSSSSDKQLTHVNDQGKATMVDVTQKSETLREATASAIVDVGPQIAQLIAENNMKKGDVLSVAQIAGIIGAKRTAELIPLCHNIVLSSVKVETKLNLAQCCVQLQAKVRCLGQTGVEMEALTAVSIAALTVYDMCKAVSHDIKIKNIQLCSKSGGKRNFKRALD